ncbi:glycosyltransferase [Enterococcus casseliflavus]|uniref:Glycosyltransferase n=1 Tax=Enterococcus casseliflavus TaxID=37734 RepID=A0ABD6Z2F1_ENTCA|nr:glycosyltransferase [Enterococcus casseliflavus]EOH84876.1 hypothetical protein UAM_00541 [Enterococcus casseliflavus ATCC 49996]EOU10615.1 hypothetical protein I582_01128 [Enterococcus casseliflavus ATCC 49996]MBE9878558.1 glycosyltransferase family 2 protein [Enterococcus casseliflavus]QGN29038.1 glycosyltransferase [Enterococcus casseliflavus]QQB84485.1 glycosyltransferase family 2 protein [Enterococcus casseliflavus]
MGFCFVVLHYKTLDDTDECVQSINNLNKKSNIVIVDNASNNGSVEILKEKYKDYSHIIILENDYNMGFSEGNNIGYQYARNILKADFIAVLNNDVTIGNADFIERVVEEYNESKFYLLGPDIISTIDYNHQNPMKKEALSQREAKQALTRFRLLYILSKIRCYELFKRKSKKKLNNNKSNEYTIKMENMVLHGSFVIFSPLFTKKENFCFRPGTFLYMEEDILYRYCLSKKYKMLYSPNCIVYHKEDSATNSLFKADKEKREFVFKNLINSLKVYLDYV